MDETDSIPRQPRSESRSTEEFLADLAEISALAKKLGVESNPDDFRTIWTTGDLGTFER